MTHALSPAPNFTVIRITVKSASLRELIAPRVLVVALSGIGNLLLASPLFRALKDANPRAAVDVLVAPRGTREVLEKNPRIRAILVGKPKPSLAEWWQLVSTIRQHRYDVGIVTHPGQLITSALLLAAGRVRRRIGHRYHWSILRNSGLCLTDPVDVVPHRHLPLTDRSAHDVVQNLRLLEPLGVSAKPADVHYDFPLTPDDRAAADTWLAAHAPEARTLFGLHPGAHKDLAYKRWPADRWSELGDRLSEQSGATILVFGGPDEHALQTEVSARMRAPAVAVPAPLRTTAALIARCALFVSNDSGLMHVAASQGVPTVGLFGPTDERRTAPWGPQSLALRAPGTAPTYDVAQLAAARATREPHSSLLALRADEVTQTISARFPALAPQPAQPPS